MSESQIPFESNLGEAVPKRETVIKGGRIVSKLTPSPGHKMQGNKSVRVSAKDRVEKQRAAVKGARARKTDSSIAPKRTQSLEKRRRLGL